MIIAGTGSRRFREDAYPGIHDLLYEAVNTALDDEDECGDGLVIMSGGAEGWDEYLANFAIDLGLQLWLALPNATYGDYYWGKMSVHGIDRSADFQRLMDHARITYGYTYVCDGVYEGRIHANFVRNQFMVDRADHMLVLDPEMNGTVSKGTMDCLRKTLRAGVAHTIFGRENGSAKVIWPAHNGEG